MSQSPAYESLSLHANGIDHHVLHWPGDPARTVLIVHGYLDHARSFVPIGDALSAAGFRVIAPDLRGHGRSGWVPRGGYYYFPDYVADLDAQLELLCPPDESGPIAMIGHSMGGGVVTMLAGTRASRVKSVALLEGLGPPHMEPDTAPARMERWLDGIRLPRVRQRKRMDSLDEAVRRLRTTHGTTVPDEVLARAAAELTESDGNGLVWRFDPLHQTTSPMPYNEEVMRAYAAKITAPVLLIDGGVNGFHFPGVEARVAWFAQRTLETLEGAGHMMHWTQPDRVSARIAAFLAPAT